MIVLATGGGGGKKAVPPGTTTQPTDDDADHDDAGADRPRGLAGRDRPRVALPGRGPLLVAATPAGAVQLLSPSTLEAGRRPSSDAAGPRAVVRERRQALPRRRSDADDAEGQDARAAERGCALRWRRPCCRRRQCRGGAPLGRGRAARSAWSGRPALSPCSSLAFAPSGVAVDGTTAYVVDTAGGNVVPYAIGSSLTAGTPIPVGKKPHGNPVVAACEPLRRDRPRDRGRRHGERRGLDDGGAARDAGRARGALGSPRLRRAVLLEPGRDRQGGESHGCSDARDGREGPGRARNGERRRLCRRTPRRARSRASTRRRVRSGRRRSCRRSTAKVVALHALAPKIVSSSGKVVVTVPIAGGSLPKSGLIVKSTAISGGNTSVELWQGGIKTAGGTKSGSGVAVRSTRQPGRVVVALGATAGAFTHAAVALAQGGRSVVITLTPKPVAASRRRPRRSSRPRPRRSSTTTTPVVRRPRPPRSSVRRPPRPSVRPPPRRIRPRQHRRPDPAASHAASAHDDPGLHGQVARDARRAPSDRVQMDHVPVGPCPGTVTVTEVSQHARRVLAGNPC